VTRSKAVVLAVVVLILALFAWPGAATANVVELVSAGNAGSLSPAEGNYDSSDPALSADGRYVAFESFAQNLVFGDMNWVSDVFVRDLDTGATTRVSVDSFGIEGVGESYNPTISADGRYVAFDSLANNLVDADTNAVMDVFVRDRDTGVTTRVSLSSAGVEGNNESYASSISADGRYVAFESLASNLVDGDTNGVADVFIHDRDTGVTTRVSLDSAEAQADGWSGNPSTSADGRYVAFWSLAGNLVAGDTNGQQDIFVRDTLTGATTRVSVDSAGLQADLASSDPAMSADGTYVAFCSAATNLVAGDANAVSDVFVHNLVTGETTRVSAKGAETAEYGPSTKLSISADGRYVAYCSIGSNLVAGDTNGKPDIFVYDRVADETTRVSVDSAGLQTDHGSYYPSMSADGRLVAFWSDATNLVAGDTNGAKDVFVHDRLTGITTRASVNNNGLEGNYDSSDPAISADGRYVAFESNANNLVPWERPGWWGEQVYVAPAMPSLARPFVTPAGGPTTGGNTVTISGRDFYGVTDVTFGGTPADSFMVDSPYRITAVTPAHAAGTVRVQVTTPEGASADTAADDYTYLGTSLAPPTALAAADHPIDNGQAVDLSWAASDGATGYRLSRGTTPGIYDHEVDLGNLTSYVDTNLTPGQTYYFALRAYDGDANLSEFSTEVSATPLDNGTEADVSWVPASEPGETTQVEVAEITITFEDVTTPGALTVTPVIPTEEVPGDFRVLDSGWEVDAGTLEFDGEATVDFPYDEAALPPGALEEELTIWHLEDGAWQNVTVPPVDTVNNLITAQVTSFSPFVLVVPSNEPPTVTAITASPNVVRVGVPVTFTASFTDPDPGDLHTATWQWDRDGAAPQTGTVTSLDSTTGQVRDTHTYTVPGLYTVILAVTDAAGEKAELSYQYVVVYDPRAGSITGDGWITSPAGAYLAKPTVSGKATFSFTYQYKKGAQTPSGTCDFQFKLGKLRFQAKSSQWLVIDGAAAECQGTGTVNGAGSYGFLISVVDTGHAGPRGEGRDCFRIKIWDKSTGATIYDSQVGDPDDAAASTELRGGRVVIHK
jgi:Tol biopolymer transport system component